MRALITGVTGFAGSHLAEHLLEQGYEVYGTTRAGSSRRNIASFERHIHTIQLDLLDRPSVGVAMRDIQPDEIYHLASQSFVPKAWDDPSATIRANVSGTINVLDAALQVVPHCKVLVITSSEVYGKVSPSDCPVTEDQPLNPANPYGASKKAQDLIGELYAKWCKLHVVRLRTFGHEGPRRSDSFAVSSFCKQVAMIEKGLQEPVLKVGNLDAIRDFTDVRDMVRAYPMALRMCDSEDVYNVASGVGRSMQEVLDMILSNSTAEVTIEQDPDRMRPSDIPEFVGDCEKFRIATGWSPKAPFEQTVLDLLNYWRAEVTNPERAIS